MDYIIGVDGGGTKTEAIAYDCKGNELNKGYSGFGNLTLNSEQAKDNIISAIDECRKGLENNKCINIYLGLAGVDSGDNRNFIKNIIKERYNTKVEVTNDAHLALASLLKGEDGILTISGTGSIAFGIKEQKIERAGGWGHILGDEGSGYYIALEAFKRMCFESDKNLPLSKLSMEIMNKLHINNVSEIKSFIYSAEKSDIAAFTPLVCKCAEEGDENAVEILKSAGRYLAFTTINVYDKLQFNGTLKIGIKGSVLTNIDLVKQEFYDTLKDKIKDFSIICEDESAAKGAYYLSLK